MKKFLKDYVKQIAQTTLQGDAREESYYPYLKEFLENIANTLNKNNIYITVFLKKQRQAILILGYGMENFILSAI